MSGFIKRLYSPVLMDITFALAGLGSAASLALGPIYHPIGGELIERSKSMGVVLVAVAVGAAIAGSFLSRFDQKYADDFIYLTLAKSALISITSLIFVLVIWQLLFDKQMGRLPSAATLPIVFLLWATAYFYTRWRGTGA